jgi:hypothetical protein
MGYSRADAAKSIQTVFIMFLLKRIDVEVGGLPRVFLPARHISCFDNMVPPLP